METSNTRELRTGGWRRSAGIISIGTALSRVLGFARDIMIAWFFGTGTAAQAFVVAFRLPNLLRDMAAEGAMSAAIVPVLSRVAKPSDRSLLWRTHRTVMWINGVILIILATAGVVFAPLLVKVVAPGFSAQPELYALTVRLSRWLFPFLCLIGMAAVTTAGLHVVGHFTAPASGPALLNLCMIGAVLLLHDHVDPPVFSLVIGVLLGGALYWAVQLPVLWRRGWRPFGSVAWTDPAILAMLRLMPPRLFGSAVHQISVLIDTVLASLSTIVGVGGVAALYFGHRLVQLPMALFATSVATATLPTLSAQAGDDDRTAFAHTLVQSVRQVWVVAAPASLGLFILAHPIVMTLFQRGAFDDYSSVITTSALRWYAPGLLAFATVKLLVNALYAVHDTRTPVLISSWALGVNLVLNLILMWPMHVGGLALATSLAAACHVCWLWRALHRRLGLTLDKSLIALAARVVCACGIMTAAIRVTDVLLLSGGGVLSHLSPVPSLGVLVGVGMLAYVMAARGLGLSEIRALCFWRCQEHG